MKKLSLLLAFAPVLLPALAGAQFALHDGDRVVFYGDSITDQRLYTLYTETFVRTRFPKLNVSFTHSGWGGDTVRGGGGGDIDTRLTRDVFAYKPMVVTVMLGMNDAAYRAYDDGIFQRYATGYRHIVDRLQREAPGVRMTLIIPSPFDDVTRAPNFPGGYNETLLKYGEFVSDLGKRNRATIADLNAPVVNMLQRANAVNAPLSQRIIPDRVHPGDAGHLTMAEALLKSWNAPSVVSAVEIEGGKVTRAENTKISGVSTKDGLSWTQQDNALPFWLDLKNPEIKLVIDSSDFVKDLNQQTVKVSGLSGRQSLSIDGKVVGTYSAEELAAGVNLATVDTPMKDQAKRVFTLTRSHGVVHNRRWRDVQLDWLLSGVTEAGKERAAALAALDKYDAALDKEARKAAQPVRHRFTLTPAP